ncbi:MAG: hypothetical protein GY861_09865 [bacterium]|nr:hypothetical protein [bacterium]
MYSGDEYYFKPNDVELDEILDAHEIEYTAFSTGTYHAKMNIDCIAELHKMGYIKDIELVPKIGLEIKEISELI